MAAPEPAMRPSSSAEPEDGVVFVGISLVLGIACRHFLRGTRVPYTVALLVIGIALGSLEYGTHSGLGKIGAGIRLWSNINPNLILFVFLPALLFESSFAMEVHQIKRCLLQMLLLAGPGVLISTFCLGTALKYTFHYGWNWKISLLLGGLLSATDPVAVVALLKDLGASKKLSTIIEGESLMNDGTAIVVYQLFYKMVLGQQFNVGDIIKFLSQVSLGAVAVGIAFGIVSVFWLGTIFNDTVIEITLTLAVSYIAYFTAQDGADVSGVLTVMTLGMFYAAFARTAFKGDSQQSLHHFWEMVAYIANTLIFILSGVVIAEGILRNHVHFTRHGTSWGYLVLLYIFVQLSRVIVVVVLYPFLKFFGYGLDWKEAIILIWSGLRGAVALSLSLSVKRASDTYSSIDPEVGILFIFFTGGIVFLTLIINGTTTQFLLHILGMGKLSAEKFRILKYTKFEMLDKALEAFSDLGDDEELGPAEWSTVQRYITCLNNLDEEKEHPHNVSEINIQTMNLKDVRVRLLNGVQAAYWGMLEEGRIRQNTANILMRSVDEAMDVVATEPLCDWDGLQNHVHFPNYYKFLQMSKFPQRLITYFTVQKLEAACCICAGFLRAHRIARRQLHDFIGNSEIASTVINESNLEGEEARKFLEDVRVALPQVLRVVKTRQVTFAILKHLSDYVQDLQKVGLLEEKEMVHLDDTVQADLKKLLRNPPLVKIQKIHELISSHPLLGAFPSSVRELLKSSTKETMKMRGSVLYKEGSKPTGIWLISTGIVKWESKTLSNRNSLHPTFSHGSTLGLYELLIGKSYFCDIVTESVVHCFFIEAEIMLSLLRSDPAIEEFLWQESAIVLAKLLLPQVFEEMPMQDLRSLVAEMSTMNNYITGEVIELRSNLIGILLEGFLKTDNAEQELVTSPATLLPQPHTNQSTPCLEISGSQQRMSFYQQSSTYKVESRVRVIFFDMSAVEADVAAAVSRTPSSRVVPPQGAELPRNHSRSHGAFLSWPENAETATRSARESEKSSFPSLLSARAVELSKYGSTGLLRHRRRHQSQQGASLPSQSKPLHSLSYPTMIPPPLSGTRPLMSAQSEAFMGSKTSTRDQSRPAPRPRHRLLKRKQKSGGAAAVANGSSDEEESSGGEEVIVRIDSPSTLSFHPAVKAAAEAGSSSFCPP